MKPHSTTAGTARRAVLLIDAPDEVIIDRISGRLTCPHGHVFHIQNSQPQREGVCDHDGEPLSQRDDDLRETVRRRLDVYHEQTEPLVAYYGRRGLLLRVDGTRPPDEVFDAVRTVLGFTLRRGRRRPSTPDVLADAYPTVGLAGAAEESSIEQARALFETNVFGSIRMTRAVLPHMREQGSGRIINVSSVLGFLPAPFMALYAATKHAIEGYSESLDHEVRDNGVRVLLVEPAYTKTSFDANTVAADEPLALYARRRQATDVLTAAAVRAGDEPSVVADAILAAATDTHPKLRYPAGTLARRASKLRRYAPPAIFDKQIRKTNQLAA